MSRRSVPASALPVETQYLTGRWAFLDDVTAPDVQMEYLEELAWEAREAAAARKSHPLTPGQRHRLLAEVARLPAPGRDLLRGYLIGAVGLDVVAVRHRMNVSHLWADLLTASRALLPTLPADLAAMLSGALNETPLDEEVAA